MTLKIALKQRKPCTICGHYIKGYDGSIFTYRSDRLTCGDTCRRRLNRRAIKAQGVVLSS